jgi:hypothetical protein
LVVTTLAFLMAGTVAVGASALLSQENSPLNASSRDLAAQDALAAAVANVAGQGSAGGSPPCSQSTLFNPTTLPSNGYSSRANCLRADGVASGPLALVPVAWSHACPVLTVSGSSTGHFLIWFTASGNANAWVDTDSAADCTQSETDCSDLVSGPVHVLACNFTQGQVGQSGNGNRNSDRISNSNDSGGGLYLHIQNSTQSPAMVRLAQYSSSGGSIYVLAAPTGVPGGPTYEVADIWVGSDGAGTALRLEGTL